MVSPVVHDEPPKIFKAVHIRRLYKFWTDGSSILSGWIRDRYIKSRDFQAIEGSQSKDSPKWKVILKLREKAMSMMHSLLWELWTHLVWSWDW